MVRQHKTPMRMCVGCREMKPKAELIRVVRPPEGEVFIDRKGKASGRGAYVCPNRECLFKAQRSKALERQLDKTIEPDVFETLALEIERREEH